MKNFTQSFSGYHHFCLNTARLTQLNQDIWNNQVLTGHYWRFYWNDMPGAGIYIKGAKVELKPDHFYIIPPECGLYTWCNADHPPRQFYVHFEMTRLNKSSNLKYRELVIEPNEYLLLKSILDNMEKSQIQKEPYLHLQIMALVSGVLAKMKSSDFKKLHTDAVIEEICNHIREKPGEKWSVPQLAKNCNMSVNLFLQKFRAVVGSSPYRYIVNMRYALAARLLEETDLTIENICEKIGISDRFHFSREFKKFYGEPPATYRHSRMM